MIRLIFLIAASMLAGCATSPPPQALDARLHILLTNDDGYGTVGIETLKDALRGAGHRVTVVAPSGNRSGSSASLTFGAIPVEEVAAGEYSADGSPATCALIGLTAMADPADPFDLLVSGTNAGANAGAATGVSGTVGATTAAVGFAGLPALAVSANELGREGEPRHRRHFEQTADLAVRLVARLAATAGGGSLLPPGTRLNLNVPGIAFEETKGVRFGVQGTNAQFGLAFEKKAQGIYAPAFRAPSTTREDVPGSDAAALSEGWITLVLLDTDYTAPIQDRRNMERRLADF